MTDVLRKISSHFENTSVYMLGEIFGKVQDLTYGLQTTALRVFDIFVGDPVHGRYLNDLELDEILKIVNVERVPVLYRGPFSIEKMTELRDGNTTFANIKQIREGIVIRSSIERKNKWIGRVQLKFVSPEYLLRKNKDATEFQ
jgi:RNA ligase (TIGR02306 family)